MIQDQKTITINAPLEEVFEFIYTMPNKFPVYEILEKKPFFFLRVLLVDGWSSATEAVNIEMPDDVFILQQGDYMGAFQLSELEKPFRYGFTLRSFFFKCRTGYSLRRHGNTTMLDFDLVAENPKLMEKIWWFFVRPFHRLLAGKVLKVIREKVEMKKSSPGII